MPIRRKIRPEEEDDVAQDDVRVESVTKHFFADDRSLVLELAGGVERAVARETDLDDDRHEHEHRPQPVQGAHAVPSR